MQEFVDNGSNPIGLLLIDVPTLLRSTLQAALRPVPNFVIVGDIASPDAASWSYSIKPRVVLVGIGPETKECLMVIKDLRARLPSTGIVVVSMSPCLQQLCTVTNEGVRGYLTWSASITDLLAVVLVVAQGGRAYCPQSTQLLENSLISSMGRLDAMTVLSPREIDIAALVARGKSNHEIASLLDISVKTVECYVTRLLRKTGVRSRVELATTWVHGQPVLNAELNKT